MGSCMRHLPFHAGVGEGLRVSYGRQQWQNTTVEYGTVMNEGANKGILVTTSDYGPDAYAFANGKPLVLLNGSNLLHLLEKHGYKARINLQEARKIAMSQPSR